MSSYQDVEAGRRENTIDPITAEVIRNALVSAAEQMKIALRRTAFSSTVYEGLDCACALYDRDVRLLAQATTVPVFLGTMNFCIEGSLRALGGEKNLEPDDVILNTWAYDIGTHAQDAAIVVPVFVEQHLVGYAVTKAHLADLGATGPYLTNSTDNFQEGVIFPGVKLYRQGELQGDIYRTVLANSRLPDLAAGDLNAEIAAARTGSTHLIEIVARFGRERFERSVERIINHGEATARRFIEGVPDGRYVASGDLDDNGVETEPVTVTVAVEVTGSNILVDFSGCPGEQLGPMNSPFPMTVSAARFAIMAVVGRNHPANEGYFRSVEVIAPSGSMFNPRPPAPIYLCAHSASFAIDLIHRALAAAVPGAVRAGSGGTLCSMTWWGTDSEGRYFGGGMDHATGQGATNGADGGGPLIHISNSGGRNTSVEVLEATQPLLVGKLEFIADSGGAGQWQGGTGVDVHYRPLQDISVTVLVDRTRTVPWGLHGGEPGLPNALAVRYPDGREVVSSKVTSLHVPRDSEIRIRCGAGGGYGLSSERDPGNVRRDVTEGYVSEARARAAYGHAYDTSS